MFSIPLVDGKLLAKGEVLQRQVRPGPKEVLQHRDESEYQGSHAVGASIMGACQVTAVSVVRCFRGVRGVWAVTDDNSFFQGDLALGVVFAF